MQVTETGWGEFEIQIKIYLADPVERPVTIYHVLKLFQVSKKVNNARVLLFLFWQTGTGPSTDPSALKGGKSVVSEFYDEIIFQDPTQYIQVGRPLTKSLYDILLIDVASPDHYQTAHYGGSQTWDRLWGEILWILEN